MILTFFAFFLLSRITTAILTGRFGQIKRPDWFTLAKRIDSMHLSQKKKWSFQGGREIERSRCVLRCGIIFNHDVCSLNYSTNDRTFISYVFLRYTNTFHLTERLYLGVPDVATYDHVVRLFNASYVMGLTNFFKTLSAMEGDIIRYRLWVLQRHYALFQLAILKVLVLYNFHLRQSEKEIIIGSKFDTCFRAGH